MRKKSPVERAELRSLNRKIGREESSGTDSVLDMVNSGNTGPTAKRALKINEMRKKHSSLRLNQAEMDRMFESR